MARFLGLFGLAVFSVFLASCSLTGRGEIFAAVYEWRQGNYGRANRLFSAALARADASAEGASPLADYARFGMGTTFLAQEDYAPALAAFSAVSGEAPRSVRYAAAYNAGILASRRGDYKKAEEFFIQALRIDSSRIDAKINLELSQKMSLQAARAGERELLPAEEKGTSAERDAVFPVLREMDAHQWKNRETETRSSGGNDY
jgi:tetratricopeptide (TPR) repeat protein